jgi:hypothetical protein
MSDYKKVKERMTPCFIASDFPDDVDEDRIDHEIYETGLINIYWWDAGGPLVEWLKAQGVEETDDKPVWVGIWN